MRLTDYNVIAIDMRPRFLDAHAQLMTRTPAPPASVVQRARGDGLLTERIRSGDREALGEIYDRYGAAAFATVVRNLGDVRLAEDVVHDAFVAAWREIDRFDPSRESLAAWLLGLLRARSRENLGTPPSVKGGRAGAPAAVTRGAAHILVIDDDRAVGEVVTAILEDRGYEVTTLDDISDRAVRAAIDRTEPDCILLDGAQATEYAEAWVTAAEVRHRARPIPTVMFTSHTFDAAEASRASSHRAVEAGFFAVLPKPFTLDELVATVERAIAESVPFNPMD